MSFSHRVSKAAARFGGDGWQAQASPRAITQFVEVYELQKQNGGRFAELCPGNHSLGSVPLALLPGSQPDGPTTCLGLVPHGEHKRNIIAEEQPPAPAEALCGGNTKQFSLLSEFPYCHCFQGESSGCLHEWTSGLHFSPKCLYRQEKAGASL